MNKVMYLALGLIITAPAYASSPGMTEGPPGCSWKAVYQGPSADSEYGYAILTDFIGQCMSFVPPTICGEKGIRVKITTLDIQQHKLTPGTTADIWVNGQDGNLTHPGCTRTPDK